MYIYNILGAEFVMQSMRVQISILYYIVYKVDYFSPLLLILTPLLTKRYQYVSKEVGKGQGRVE